MSDDTSNINELDQPIARRRGKRRSAAISPDKQSAARSAMDGPDNLVPLTPSKARSKKRVRFSDPGSPTVASSAASSGLTPYVQRTTLSTPRRRASTPAATRSDPLEIQFTPMRQALDDRAKRRIRRNGLSQEMNAYESDRKDKVHLEKELHAKDLELQKVKKELQAAKQAQDTFNHHTVEALSSSQRIVEAELDDLRQSFNDASTPDGLYDDMDVNWDAVNVHKAGTVPGPASDGGDTIPIHEDEAEMFEPSTPRGKKLNAPTTQLVDTTADRELLAMALDLETAKQEKKQLFKNLRAHIPVPQPVLSKSTASGASLHFEDSPASSFYRGPSPTTSTTSLPSPPKTFYADLSKALKSTTHRAEIAELALHALETDLHALGFTPSANSPTTSILENIRAHFRQARLDLERAVPGETSIGLNEPSQVLPEAISKLKLLSRRVHEREAELRSMHEQQRTLKGNFECGLRAAEKANQRIKELEDAVEEGAADLLHMRTKLQATEKDGVEKDHTVTSLIAALEKYRSDVARLEGLVIQLENEQSFKVQETRDETAQKIEELEAKAAAESTGRHEAEERAIARLGRNTALHAALDAANSDASALQIQLSALEAQRADSEVALRASMAVREQQHELALQGLNTRLSTLSTALATSQSEATRLNALVGKLQSRLQISEEASTRAVEVLWQEQIRSVTKASEIRKSYVRGCKVRGANWEMEDEDAEAEADAGGNEGDGEPMTPVSLVRFVDVEAEAGMEAEAKEEGEVEGRVEITRGRSRGARRLSRSRGLGIKMSMSTGMEKGRRRGRLDSGVGMGCLSEEDEQEGEDEEVSSDAVMPSSDSGFDIHEDPFEVALPASDLGLQE